jgi:hypothetical protein
MVTLETYTNDEASVFWLVLDELVLELLLELVLLLPEVLSAAQANGTIRTSRKIHKSAIFAFMRYSGNLWIQRHGLPSTRFGYNELR